MMSSNSSVNIIEPGDEVEVIDSVNKDIIGKKYRVTHCYNDDFVLTGVLGGSSYDIARHKVKLSKKKSEFSMWSKPPIKGGNCRSCSKFNEYQESDYICYECK